MKELYKIAADASLNVYSRNVDLGTIEYSISTAMWHNTPMQILAIAGTNETWDWLANLDFRSTKGIKRSALLDAEKIQGRFIRYDFSKLLVTGHSKGGAAAIAFHKLFRADYCIAFAPARCLRRWTERTLKDTTIFIDPDDIVHKLGFLGFSHPICTHIEAVDNEGAIDISSHNMSNWIEFVKGII